MDVDLSVLCVPGTAGASGRPFFQQLPLPRGAARSRVQRVRPVPLPPPLSRLHTSDEEEYYLGPLTLFSMPYMRSAYEAHPQRHVLVGAECDPSSGALTQWFYVPSRDGMYVMSDRRVVSRCTVTDFIARYASFA